MEILPDEVWNYIFNKLDFTVPRQKDLCLVSHNWQFLLNDLDYNHKIRVSNYSISIIDQYRYEINWQELLYSNILKEEFIERYFYQLDYENVPHTQNLSINFIRKYYSDCTDSNIWKIIKFQHPHLPSDLSDKYYLAVEPNIKYQGDIECTMVIMNFLISFLIIIGPSLLLLFISIIYDIVFLPLSIGIIFFTMITLILQHYFDIKWYQVKYYLTH